MTYYRILGTHADPLSFLVSYWGQTSKPHVTQATYVDGMHSATTVHWSLAQFYMLNQYVCICFNYLKKAEWRMDYLQFEYSYRLTHLRLRLPLCGKLTSGKSDNRLLPGEPSSLWYIPLAHVFGLSTVSLWCLIRGDSAPSISLLGWYSTELDP